MPRISAGKATNRLKPLVLLLFLAITLALAGCGKDESVDPKSDQGEPENAPSTQSEANHEADALCSIDAALDKNVNYNSCHDEIYRDYLNKIDPPDPGLGGTLPYYPFLLRQSDCSLNRIIIDSTNQVVRQEANYQDYLHRMGGVTTTADRFPKGCVDPTTGIPLQAGAVLGKLANGNSIVGAQSKDGILVSIVSPTGSIVSANDYPVLPSGGIQVFGMAAADLNHDGFLDVVVSSLPNTASASLAILMSNGDGTFRNGTTITVPVPQLPVISLNVTIDDMNGDGKLDLVAVTEAASSTSGITVFLGNGDGTFLSTGLSGPAGVGGASAVTADFNGDGKKDLATSNGAILLGKGDGTFQLMSQSLPSSGTTRSVVTIAAGDFNQDGKIDLALTNVAGTVDVFFGNGDATFTYSASYPAIYDFTALQTSDLDGDGFPDLFLGTAHGGVFTAAANTQGLFQSLLNYGDGTFGKTRAYFPGALNASLSGDLLYDVANFTGGSTPDVLMVAGGAGPAALSVLKGNGDGTFATAGVQTRLSSPAAAQYGEALVAGDLDGDGKPDAVFAWTTDSNGASPHISVSLGKGDGTFQAQRDYVLPAAVLSGLARVGSSLAFVNSLAIADLNGDGRPDLVFLASPDATPSAATQIYVMLNNGDGTLATAKLIDSQPYMTWLVVASLGANGKASLLVNSAGNPAAKVSGAGLLYLGSGSGTFQPVVNLNPGMAYPVVAAVADMNADGKPDVVMAGTAADNFTGEVTVLLGNGDGSFQKGKTTAQPANKYFGSTSGIAIADVSGDGVPDLLLGNCCAQSYILAMVGNGDGTFNSKDNGNYLAGLGNRHLKIADLTGLHRPDLLFTSAGTGNLPFTLDVMVAAPPPALQSLKQLSSAAAGVSSLAAGSLASAFGNDLATGQPAPPGLPWPTSLGGTSVVIIDSTGAVTAAPLTYVSPTQVNFQVPATVATGAATVVVISGDGTASSSQSTIANLAPALFTLNTASLAAAYAACVSSSGAITTETPFQVVNGSLLAQPLNLGACSQTILELYGTGLDNATALGTQVMFGQVAGTVLYAGPGGGFPGLDQINVVVPPSLAGSGTVSVTINVNGFISNTVTIAIQ